MFLSPVCHAEVERVIRDFLTKTASDVNNISTWLIKRCSKNILGLLTTITHFSFSTGVFPSMLKLAKIVPIHKKDDSCLANNHRPIPLSPVISKIFEKLFLNQLLNFF